MNTPSIQFDINPLATPPAQTVGHGSSTAIPGATPFDRIAMLAEELGHDGVVEAAAEAAKRMPLPEEIDAENAIMDRANLSRQQAAQDLAAMVWTSSSTGEPLPLKLTSSRYANYEWLRRARRGPDAIGDVTFDEAMGFRFHDAALLLFLCASPPLPFGSAPENVLRSAEEWMDEHIPVARQQASLAIANAILDLTDMFVPVPRETEADEDAEAQKKRHLQDGKPVT